MILEPDYSDAVKGGAGDVADRVGGLAVAGSGSGAEGIGGGGGAGQDDGDTGKR